MAEGINLDKKLAAQVLFSSDRTCCVCREPDKKTQIHHIDGNPGNNSFDNLCVICLDCHSDAHTNQAFTRNLTPDLICLYNESWRSIVKTRTNPAASEPESLEFYQEILLEISLSCHDWKNLLLSVAGPPALSELEGDKDVWDSLSRFELPDYSKEAWEKFQVVFDHGLHSLSRRIENLILFCTEGVPRTLRPSLMRSSRQLFVQRRAYAQVPKLKNIVEDLNPFFKLRVSDVIKTLTSVSRLADKTRKAIADET